ncbi:MAG: helix-turn-helix transcriptional regulator [bacterium]|nr:MAG: helix-turn-helix transcriptional regulator [bacterium]
METIDLFRMAVKDILSQKNITQIEIAKKIDVTPSSMNDFLQGRRGYPDYKREKIAVALGSTYVQMLHYAESFIENNKKISHLTDNKIIMVGSKKIQLNTIFAKVRIILSAPGVEKEYLIRDINDYYDKIKERQLLKETLIQNKNKK